MRTSSHLGLQLIAMVQGQGQTLVRALVRVLRSLQVKAGSETTRFGVHKVRSSIIRPLQVSRGSGSAAPHLP